MPLASVQSLSPQIARAAQELRSGGFVMLYDADGREEETDLVVASQFCSPDHIRRMRSDAGGLICVTLHPDLHGRLGLPYLSDLIAEAGDRHPLLARLANGRVPYESQGSKPSFSLSINHRDTFTGVTDNDRALTISRLAALAMRAPTLSDPILADEFASQFKSPGHVFLLNAQPELVARRRGHTELSTALLELAGLAPTATICEMMNGPSGRALPKADAIKYAAQNGLVFLEGREVISAWEQTVGARKPA